MSSNLFNRLKTKLCNHEVYWHQRCDALEVLGLLPEQKMTGARRMLAYGSCADQCAEIIRMGESTTLKCLNKWCTQIVHHYKDRYLRSPNPADWSHLLARAEHRGFPGMIGSIDCMHWEWKNCSTTWQGSYSGAQNDLNVLDQSDIFNSNLEGISPQVTYKVNGSTYNNTYYLADGIYPRYSSFVKTIPNPQSDAEKLFTKKQESYHKDVERCFGILQSHWAIVRHAEEEFVENEEEDLNNPNSAFTIYDGPTDQNGDRILHDPVQRAQQSQAFDDRLTTLQSAYLHTELQNVLVKHNWFLETGEQ
ncbi:hypothetical protein QQ045_030135 [Rhodiola kirilowii]